MQSNIDSQQTIQQLINIVGQQHVLTHDNDTRLYLRVVVMAQGKSWLLWFLELCLNNGKCYKLL